MSAPSSERERALRHFLARVGWADAKRANLAGDASFRRYERVSRDDARAVLMDAPPRHEDIRPFLAIARHLSALELRAPTILAADEAAGFILLEDFGDDRYSRLLEEGQADEALLYGAAVDLLSYLHGKAPPPALARYDEARLLTETELFLDWYLPHRTGVAVGSDLRQSYRAAFAAVLPRAWQVPGTLALRDYHADNLMWLAASEGEGTNAHLRRVGLLDFQDAIIAPLPYDLVSLLEDARRDVPPALAEAMIARYLVANPVLSEADFRAAYAVLGAQRNVRILGVFARLCVRDKKPRYLDYLPRVWGLVEHDLRHPALAPVAAWFARHAPPQLRERAP